MRSRCYRFVPPGRLPEVAAEPGAELLAYTTPMGIFDDYRITRYASREALEAFCRAGSKHHAVVKTPVPGNLLTNPNTERSV